MDVDSEKNGGDDEESPAQERADEKSLDDGGPPTSHVEAMDVDQDRSEARSIVSRDDRDSERGDRGVTKREARKEREREAAADKRNILTLDLLIPVLREQGYHLGCAPYFVN